jgi:ABC-2 type transport system permease protein
MPNRFAANSPQPAPLPIYLKEIKYEFLKNFRMPMYTVATLGFPIMFYVLFGILMGKQQIGNTSQALYLIASYGTFGVMGASLYGTAAGLAAERGLGWLQVKRASPMPPFAYFAAKIAMSLIFSAVVVLALMLIGVIFGGADLQPAVAAKILATLLIGSLPFCALGLAVGYFAGPNSAAAVINLIYLPISFCSGLWIPFMFLPKFLQHIAHGLPSYHLSQLVLQLVGAGRGEPASGHWEFLLAFGLICLGIGRIGFQRDEGKLYG